VDDSEVFIGNGFEELVTNVVGEQSLRANTRERSRENEREKRERECGEEIYEGKGCAGQISTKKEKNGAA
jgi:hypothetical protein